MSKHEHDWKVATDWNWGPGTTVYECFPCRGLRIVRPEESPVAAPVHPLGLEPYTAVNKACRVAFVMVDDEDVWNFLDRLREAGYTIAEATA